MKNTDNRHLLAQLLSGQPISRQQLESRPKAIKRLIGVMDEGAADAAVCITYSSGRKRTGQMPVAECRALAAKTETFHLFIDDL